MDCTLSTEPVAATSECTPQQARYAKLLSLSSEELNGMAVRLHRMGGHVRLRFAEVLLALHETGQWKALGCSSVGGYAMKIGRYEPSTTFDYIRIARKLLGLPATTTALEHGVLSWSDVGEVTRVAEEETEEEWIDFAKKRSFRALKAEVRYALKNKRKLPRADRDGLPRLRSRLIFELEPEEREIVEKALHKARAEMGESLAGEYIEPKSALLYLSEQSLMTGPAGEGPGKVENALSPFAILFNRCADCRKARLVTADGPVEVPSEVVDRIEGDAHRVEISLEEEFDLEMVTPDGGIDRPNTASFVKKVAFRDGLKCANPHCGKKDHLHSHHLIFRSKGGRTVLINAVLLCKWCHAAVHQGLLVIEGNPLTGLSFTTRADKLNLALEAEKDELMAISQLGISAAAPRCLPPPAPPRGRPEPPERAEEAAPPQSPAPGVEPEPSSAPSGPSGQAAEGPRPATPEFQSAASDREHEPPRPRWEAPGDSGIPESRPGRSPGSKVRHADLRLVFLALKKLGYTAAEATERVKEAVRRLEGRRDPVRTEEILRAALGGRLAPDRSALHDSG